MNRKLIRVVDWQIKVDDANPVYRSGIYTAENEKQSLRIFIKSEAERSRLAPQIRNYPIKDDSRRLIPLSAWEKRFATGELLPSETNVSESLVRAYKEKAEEKTIWLPGLAWYSLTKNKERKIPHPYLKAVEALALPVIAGISGTCDYIMTMGAYLGLNQQNDLVSARIAMLGFLSDIQNHTVCEVMMASKSFGMQYKPRADFYKDICPKDPKFIERLQEQQSIQNVLMPDEYLTESYMLSKTKELGFM